MDPEVSVPAAPPSPDRAPEGAGGRGGAPRRSIPVIAVIAFGVFLVSQVATYIAAAVASAVLIAIASIGAGSVQSFPTYEFVRIGLFLDSVAVAVVAPAVFLLASRSFALKGEERTAKPLKVIAIVLAVLHAVSLMAAAIFPSDSAEVAEIAEQVDHFSCMASEADVDSGGRGDGSPDMPAFWDDFPSNGEMAQHYGCPYVIEGTGARPPGGRGGQGLDRLGSPRASAA